MSRRELRPLLVQLVVCIAAVALLYQTDEVKLNTATVVVQFFTWVIGGLLLRLSQRRLRAVLLLVQLAFCVGVIVAAYQEDLDVSLEIAALMVFAAFGGALFLRVGQLLLERRRGR